MNKEIKIEGLFNELKGWIDYVLSDKYLENHEKIDWSTELELLKHFIDKEYEKLNK